MGTIPIQGSGKRVLLFGKVAKYPAQKKLSVRQLLRHQQPLLILGVALHHRLHALEEVQHTPHP
jgi:hypothetical protein